jgi:hypothetical protein
MQQEGSGGGPIVVAGVFGNAPHAGQIEHWLKEFGLDVTLERSGAVEFFEAQLPTRRAE